MGNDEIAMEKEETTTARPRSRAAMDNNGNAGDGREAESASLSPESPPRIQQAHMGLQRDLTKQLEIDLDLTTMTRMQMQRQPSDEMEGQAEGRGMGHGQGRRGVEGLDIDLGHHQHMPSSMSGYDTARQTPTPKYGGSFISSSSDSNTFSGATLGNGNGNAPPSASPSPTAMGAGGGGGGGGEESKQVRRQTLAMPCSPEDSEVHHSYPHVDMDSNNIDADTSGQPPLRTRMSSEDNEHVGASAQNQLSGSAPKFYDSEIESVSGSLLYGGGGGGNPSSNNFRKMMMRNNNERFGSMTSIGNDTFIQLSQDTDGDDGDPDISNANVINSGGQGQQHPFNSNTPNSHKNSQSQGSSTGTPYTSNLTKGGGLRQNRDRGIGGGQDVEEPVLPYHKRKQLTEQQKMQHTFTGGSGRGNGSEYDRDMEDVHGQGQGPIPNSGRKSRRAPELSTITAPAPLRRSPNKQQTQNYSNNSNSNNNSNPHPYHGQYQNQLPPMSGGGGQYGSSSNNNNYAQPPRNRSASDNDYNNNNNNGHQPPRHPKNMKKSHSHDPGNNGNYYNNDPNSTPNPPPPAASSGARPPALHVRMESSGSVSSLGSLTGGASISRREGRKLAQRLGLELQEYQDQGAGTGTGRDHRQDHDGSGHGHGNSHSRSHRGKNNNSSGRDHGHATTGRTRERHDSEGQHDDGNGYISTFLKSIDFTTEGSFASFGSLRSVEDEKADYHKKGQKFLKKAEKERARQERKKNKGGDRTWIPGIGDKGRTIRSLSPANRSQHEQNRSRLPSIDNDNWEEDDRRKHKKQNSKGSSFKGSSKGGGMKKKLSGSGSSGGGGGGGGGSNHNHRRPPIRNKRSTSTHGYGTSGAGQGGQQHNSNLGSSGGGGSGGRNSSSRSHRSRNRNQPLNPNSRDRGGGYSDRNRNRSHYQSPSESENSSEEEESCISSDFTSNRYDSDGEDSSVYVDDSEAASASGSEDDYLSYGDDDDDDEDYLSEEEDGNERTTLLPSGDNTDEYDGRQRRNGHNNLPPRKNKDKSRYRDGNNRRLDRDSRRQQEDKRYHRDQGPTRYDSRNKSRSRKDVGGGGYRDRDSRDLEYGGYDDARDRDRDYGRGGYDPDIRQLLHEERLAMEKQMRKAMMEEWQENQLHNRFGRWVGSGVKSVTTKVGTFCTNAEAFISNLPLTIGAVALAVVTLGVVWFKFSEEMMDSCMPVHFHSDQCNFPEFPGCFYCDTSVRWYKIAYGFHNTCTAIALVISMLFLLKIVIARKVVIDEMNSPTTSSPAGLICMTLVCVCAGRGLAGQIMVSIAAAAHFCLALWFIYMASAYNILPDPSWYPNTVGIGISAVKTWLYYPMLGHFLMLTSMTLFSIFYPISLFRVAVNKKLSAPVSWIQMSAPAVSLYALTIMAQPSFEEEHPDITDFQRVHRMLYLPAMHFFFVSTILGALSSVQSLIARWDTFSKKPFSPAHAAFCFPTLAHANAVQAYRGAIDSFSDIQPGSPLKIALFCYWFFVLIVGTLSTFIITAKFFYMLPSWTRVDIEDEIEPPQPHETLISDVILAGETYRQNFVSPAVLQANETGALIQIRERGKSKYVRTRRVTALGFEPIMNIMELQNEREKLLEWVEKNPPRQRKRTLSVPGITIPGSDFGSNNVGVYGAMSRSTPSSEQRRRRAQTSDGNYAFTGRYPV